MLICLRQAKSDSGGYNTWVVTVYVLVDCAKVE